ncbi:hypothetical protein ENTCAN_08521 [Enterobacter cancerogenus ATCC 35316]|nr:hypothetical protein ENTCAN_08521 [Enterobacter cancerogenus ATCC 35316]
MSQRVFLEISVILISSSRCAEHKVLNGRADNSVTSPEKPSHTTGHLK